MVMQIPLKLLYNIPTKVFEQPLVDRIKAGIPATGIINPFQVKESGGLYAVMDGAYRLEALNQMRQEGRVSADYPVPCIVLMPQIIDESSKLFPFQEKIVKQVLAAKDKMFVVSTPARQEGKTFFDFENQNIPIVHDEIMFDMSRCQTGRITNGPWRNPDWASFEIRLAAAEDRIHRIGTKERVFDLGDQW